MGSSNSAILNLKNLKHNKSDKNKAKNRYFIWNIGHEHVRKKKEKLQNLLVRMCVCVIFMISNEEEEQAEVREMVKEKQ